MNYRIWILISLLVGSCQLEGEDNGQLYSTLSNTLECWKDLSIQNAEGYSIRKYNNDLYVGGSTDITGNFMFTLATVYKLNKCGEKISELNVSDEEITAYAAYTSQVNDLVIDSDENIFIAKYSSDDTNTVKKYKINGELLWSDNSTDYPLVLMKDSQENVISLGDTTGNHGDNTADSSNWSDRDIIINKFSSSGKMWSYQVGSVAVGGFKTDNAISLEIDQNDDIYVLGTTQGNLAGTNLDNSSGTKDVVVLKINSSGNLVWKKQFGTNTTENPHLIKYQTSGDELWVFVSSSGDLDNDASTATSGIFLVKINAVDGSEISRSLVFDGTGLTLNDAFEDGNGNLFIVGDEYISVIYQQDVFLKKIDANGNQVLHKKIISSTAVEYARSGIVISDKIFLTGSIDGNLFVRRFDLNGNSDTN